MVKLKAKLVDVFNIRQESTTRTSWMANNAIPDSIIMNMICRSLVPPVAPKVRSTKVGLTPKNTLRILNTIKPVTMVFTAMDKAKLVIIKGSKGSLNVIGEFKFSPMDPSVHLSTVHATVFKFLPLNVNWESDPSQVARGNKLKLAYQMPVKID